MAVGILTILAGLMALAAGYFYFFGISPEMKRKMEQQALKTMGENKMSYMAKGESCYPRHCLGSTDTLQIASTRSPPPTKKMSRTSRRASATLLGVPHRTQLESKLVKPRTHSPVLLLVANVLSSYSSPGHPSMGFGHELDKEGFGSSRLGHGAELS